MPEPSVAPPGAGPAPAGPTPLESAAADLATAFRVGTPRPQTPTLTRDLTFGQARLLFLLDREGPQPMGRIAQVFDLSSTASTGFVGRVERHGLVERRHRSDDRRVVECALTDTGRRFIDELSGFRLEAMRQTLSVLDADELAEFSRLLRLVISRHRGAA